MIPPHNHHFQPGELRWFIDHEKLAPAPLSPLADLGRIAPTGNHHAFHELGLLNDAWRTARAALAHPHHHVRVQTSDEESPGLTHFYSDGLGLWVGCWREGDGWRVSFPWTPDALVKVKAASVARSQTIAPATPAAAHASPAAHAPKPPPLHLKKGPEPAPKPKPRPRQTSALPHIRPPAPDLLCSNPKCGKPIPWGKRFCSSCGKKVS